MAVEIKMPQLSDTMNAGKILSWNKKEGDTISRGDILAEVETEKANLEIESFHQGTLLKILVPANDTAAVGSVIAVIGEPGETFAGGSPAAPKTSPASATPEVPVATPASSSSPAAAQPAPAIVPSAPAATGDRIKASPLARKLAEEHHIDLGTITGTGPAGRIVSRDLGVGDASSSKPLPSSGPSLTPTKTLQDQALQLVTPPAPSVAASAPSTPAPVSAPALSTPSTTQPSTSPAATPSTTATTGTLTPLSKMRETIARRMQESVTQSPHFYTTASIDMDDAVKLREALKVRPEFKGISVNHLVLKAAAYALAREPRVNAAMRDNMLYQPHAINIGIITAIEDGLLIPVIRSADKLSLQDLVFEGRAAVERARAGRPSPTDLVGGTFSISNMGMYDIESFTAIINPGQGAVLAVSSIQEVPVVKNGTITIGKQMRVTLSVDHRIIDGVMAGTWLKYFKAALETPALLLLP